MNLTISLVMDQDAADFYIEMIEDYMREHPGDTGVAGDLKDLRSQYDVAFGDDE